jgi:hypothetical protein
VPSYSVEDNAYKLLATNATSTFPASGHSYVTLRIGGETKYLDLTILADTHDETPGATASTPTSYQAIIDYYNTGKYGNFNDLQTTLQSYADHLIFHVWQPDTTIPGSYAYKMSASKTYDDVRDASQWYYAAVYYNTDIGMVEGVGGSKYNQSGIIDLASTITICYRLAGNTTTSSDPWYAPQLAWAKEKGLVAATADPNATVTRDEFFTMVYKTCEQTGKYNMALRADITGATDYSSVPAASRDIISWCVAAKLIGGTVGGQLTIDPAGAMSRGQLAQLVMNFYKNV